MKCSVKQDKIGILLLNWNGKRDTLECLESLRHLTYPHCEIIVVDNGSTDDSLQALRSLPITLLETGANLGFAGGNNIGIEYALKHSFDWIFLLNNDTTVAPDILDRLLDAASAQPNAKLLGAKILRYDKPQVIDHLGGTWNASLAEFVSPENGLLDDGTHDAMKSVDYACGAALFIHRSVFLAIGLLETRYFLFWEESDFCYRAKRAGFEVWTAPKAKVWHKVSSSFQGGKPHMHYYWWRSRLLFVARNFTPRERRRLYRRVLLPDIFKALRHSLLRLPSALVATRRPKLKRTLAGLTGIYHYLRRRFGPCPAWISNR